ncbi:MAG: hypothetical protein Q4G48_03270, partial [Bacteroidia bacterium]|nr:hypothetical protein [Bacteroidia bacterium]
HHPPERRHLTAISTATSAEGPFQFNTHNGTFNTHKPSINTRKSTFAKGQRKSAIHKSDINKNKFKSGKCTAPFNKRKPPFNVR